MILHSVSLWLLHWLKQSIHLCTVTQYWTSIYSIASWSSSSSSNFVGPVHFLACSSMTLPTVPCSSYSSGSKYISLVLGVVLCTTMLFCPLLYGLHSTSVCNLRWVHFLLLSALGFVSNLWINKKHPEVLVLIFLQVIRGSSMCSVLLGGVIYVLLILPLYLSMYAAAAIICSFGVCPGCLNLVLQIG